MSYAWPLFLADYCNHFHRRPDWTRVYINVPFRMFEICLVHSQSANTVCVCYFMRCWCDRILYKGRRWNKQKAPGNSLNKYWVRWMHTVGFDTDTQINYVVELCGVETGEDIELICFICNAISFVDGLLNVHHANWLAVIRNDCTSFLSTRVTSPWKRLVDLNHKLFFFVYIDVKIWVTTTCRLGNIHDFYAYINICNYFWSWN